MQSRLRVVLADDHTLLLQAFRNLLSVHFDVVGAVGDGEALVSAASELRPDVIIADVSMPGLNGPLAAERIFIEQPLARIVFLTMSEDVGVAAQAFRMGAAGFVLKSDTATELVDAIDRVAGGGRFLSRRIVGGDVEALLSASPHSAAVILTPREREVVRLLVAGNIMKQVASTLGITTRTVAFHKYRAMEALGVKTSSELIASAVRLNLL
jgi:DNA-binding NarL/FixJ family response regulator